ncbi:hypothetical protein [Helicobacter pylori]|uniref:Hac prophage II protein n=1 Tax=Helicobacter pylori GAM260BSi TaxID=1159046 RepID=M3QYC8_HELPX|nr:hypothetical protein [Helicobacter pylori]EMH25436.1 hypothetical protein HMPREF1418_00265 [Helicobacter pylori GAM260BSi]EMH69507.1 hypothetical protein HMPREF1451_00338 [Helicobacter pylori HP260BFii]
MRQEHETATSFKELKEITRIMQAKQARAQTSENANTSDPKQQSAFKPKATACAKKGHLNPTKKAFSERQKTTREKGLQESANAHLKTEQGKKSNSQAEPSNEAFKPGLEKYQENQKGGKNES